MTMMTTTIANAPGSNACPTYFKAICRTASQGGRESYATAGRKLVGNGGLAQLSPWSMEDDDWSKLVDLLNRTIDIGDEPGALAWFDRWLPRCMKLIPPARRTTFIQGVFAVAEEEGGLTC